VPSEDRQHAVIRRAYRAFAARDVTTLAEISHPNVEIRAVTGALAHGGEPYVGVEGVAEYISDVGKVWDELKLLPAEFHQLDKERTLVFGRVLARRGSTLIDTPNAWLWRVRDDKVLSAEVYGDPEAAIALFGEDGA
jgi:ketosteroid isomerase-like protein